ncbi:MAG TPA: tetratricopeptide repeat protein [Candidatus Kapabacteria bacterium]|jgi:signal transduction histidine kinase|nr:tetratricopeptide repeat protein [Candidatus Kapabacteria bacterium]
MSDAAPELVELLDRGHELLRTNDFSALPALAERALELATALPADDPLAVDSNLDARYLAAMAKIRASDFAAAEELLSDEIPDGHEPRRPRLRFMRLNARGRVYEVRNRFEEAIDCYRRLIDQSVAAGDELAEAWGYSGLGRNYRGLFRLREAIEVETTALEITRRIGNRSFETTVLTNLALVHQMLGDHARTLELFLEVRALAEEHAPHMVAGTLVNIGIVYSALKDHRHALDYAMLGLEACERSGNEAFAANAMVNVGNALLALGELDRAREYLQRGLAAQLRVGHFEHAGNARMVLGRLEQRLGHVDAARGHLDAAIELHTRARAIRGMADAYRHHGELSLELGDARDARARLEKALEIAAGNELPVQSMNAHRLLARALRELGEPERALEHLDEYDRIRRRWETDEAQATLQKLQVLHDIESARNEAELHRLRTVELASALEELKQAQTQLVHAEKMASLGQLTAGIAHEINNPVNFIRSSTSPLRRDLDEVRAIVAQALEDESAETRERVERRMRELEVDELRSEIDSLLRGIEEGASRTAEIVRGLRSFSRLGEDDLKPADLHEGLDATLTLLRPRLRDGVIVERNYGELPPVECNAGQINQVFMNILSNAIDAMEGSGRITIATSMRDDHARIEISDTGEGIDETVASRIFEPFFTTKAIGAGSGLGLSISYGIIEKHRGTIEVRSVRGEGTTFVIELPVYSLSIPG